MKFIFDAHIIDCFRVIADKNIKVIAKAQVILALPACAKTCSREGYINVEDLDESIKNCTQLGGKLIGEVRKMGTQGRYCVIQDPAGAVAALFEPAE